MISSLEPVGPGPRLDPLFLQGRGPVIDAEQARLLGLRNGQVVQAVIDNSASAFSVLWPSGQRQGLPTALQAFPLPSQWRWAAGSLQDMMAVLMPGGHIMLKPIRTGAAAAATVAPPRDTPTSATGAPTAAATAGLARSAGATSLSGPLPAAANLASHSGAPSAPTPPGVAWVPREAPGAYTLGQAFAAAQGASGSAASPELARLMQQTPAWAGLIRLLNGLAQSGEALADSAAESAGSASLPLGGRLIELLGGPLPRMASLTPAALQQAMMQSGLGTEAALLAGSMGLDQDLKVALRRWLRQAVATPTLGAESTVSRALDTLERSQIDNLTAQMQGQVLLAMVIPFGDAGPVALRIVQERSRPGDEPPPFVVDVHSAHSGLGPLWLRTQVSREQRVAITMWALREDVALQAREQSQNLRRTLHDSGLVLGALEIISGAPDAGDGVFMADQPAS